MQNLLLFIEFTVLGISLAAPVGPVKLEMIRQGTLYGFKRAFLTGAGAMTVDLIYMTFIFWGLSSFMQTSFITLLISIAGSCMLLYTGIASIRNSFAFHADSQKEAAFSFSPYFTGMCLAAANPFILVFWFSVYSSALQQLPGSWEAHIQYLFSLAVLFGILLWNVNLSFALHYFRTYINNRMLNFISFLSGCLLIGYSLMFILSISKG